MSKKPLIQLNNVSFSYKEGYSVFCNLSFSIDHNQIVSIIGESGVGKSTLLKSINSSIDIKEGAVFLGNRLIVKPSQKLMPGDKDIRLVSQQTEEIKSYYTVSENLEYALRSIAHEYREKEINNLLRVFQLEKQINLKGVELSGGQRQRLSIAMSLAVIPRLLLLDEPFNQIDLSLRNDIMEYLQRKVKLKKSKSSIILVTHHASEALKYSDRVLVMSKGTIIQDDTPIRVYKNPKNIRVGKLLGECFLYNRKIYRPEDIYVGENGVEAIVVGSYYLGGKYLVKSKIGDKKISFYSDKKIAPSERISLVGLF